MYNYPTIGYLDVVSRKTNPSYAEFKNIHESHSGAHSILSLKCQYRRELDVERSTRFGFFPFFPTSLALETLGSSTVLALDVTLANDNAPACFGPKNNEATLE